MIKKEAYLNYVSENAKSATNVTIVKPNDTKKATDKKKKRKGIGCGVVALLMTGVIALTAIATNWFLKNKDKDFSLFKVSPFTSQSINLHEVTEEKIQELAAELKADLGSNAEGLTDDELYNYVRALNDADPELNNMELEEISRILNNLGLAESINGYYGVKDNAHVENIYFSDYIVNPEVQAFYAEYDELRANLMNAMENGNNKEARIASKALYDFIVKFYVEHKPVVTSAGTFTFDSIQDDFTAVDIGKRIQSDFYMIECLAVKYPEDYTTYLNTIDGKDEVSYEENKETIVENAINDGINYSNCRGTQKSLK